MNTMNPLHVWWIAALLCMTIFTVACQSVVLVDDGVDTAVSGCAPPGTLPLLCENFESGLPATTQMRDGLTRLDADVVFDGNSSMRCETDAIESYAFIANQFAPIERGTVYFRAHIFIPAGTVEGTLKVLNLTSRASTDLEAVQSIDINVSSALRAEVYQHGNKERFQSESNLIPENKWFCLRGSYTISETTAETSVWIDDLLAVSTIASADAVITGGVSEFRTGIGWTETGQETAVVYFDDILVDTAPVSCAVPVF